MNETKIIRVDKLARVEGEGALYVAYRDGQIDQIELKIIEPPRFFEALLRGRHYTEAPDITSRICGICPVAYQMSAVHAMEKICKTSMTPTLRQLRRLLYCGEWIESHVLQIILLHAPDFFGLENVAQLAQKEPMVVTKALQLKRTGNRIIEILGGRAIHPINVKVGGFHRFPNAEAMKSLRLELQQGLADAEELVQWVAKLNFPEANRHFHYVSLHHDQEYPMNEGVILSSQGWRAEIEEFEDIFSEKQMPYSHALHSYYKGLPYAVGPAARMHLNYDLLSEDTRRLAQAVGLDPACSNPFKYIMVRALEVFYAFDEALRLLPAAFAGPHEVPLTVRAGSGSAATEAPRGLLYHRYQTDAQGMIEEAKIVAPTSQNQASIEADLAELIAQYYSLPEPALQAKCEQAIRNYDPCISCATHFLQWIRV